MQKLDKHKIWIDYAHTPDALLNALSTLKIHYPESTIRVLFGVVAEIEIKLNDKLWGRLLVRMLTV